MPTSELFIDYVKMPKIENHKLEDAVFSKIKQKLPFEPVKENIMTQYIPMENDNLLVIAAERKIIDRHLAIYEEAGLSIKSIGVWPTAMANCYIRFFGRRRSDHDSIVMLICIETNYTNVVMCRHKNLLFARSISIGLSQLDKEKTLNRLILELTACRRQFTSMYQKANIERLIFLSGNTVDREICTEIAKQLEMPAQVGDCLAATEITNPSRLDTESEGDKNSSGKPIDRRNCQVNWTIPFGLSLS
jgi:Tfp pilus assembly PilM family ATPase